MKLSYKELDALSKIARLDKPSQIASLALVALDKDGNVLTAQRANTWKRYEAGTNKKTGKPYPGGYKMQIGSGFGGVPFAHCGGFMASASGTMTIRDSKSAEVISDGECNPDELLAE